MIFEDMMGVKVDADIKFWRDFGFDPKRAVGGAADGLTAILPSGYVAIAGAVEGRDNALTEHLQELGQPPRLFIERAGAQTAVYAIPYDKLAYEIRKSLPKTLMAYGPGDTVTLPTGVDRKLNGYGARHLDELTTYEAPDQDGDVEDASLLPPVAAPEDVIGVSSDVIGAIAPSDPSPVLAGVPLERYSLLGRADELEAQVQASTPLLGNVAMAGQATIVYAPPGAGKTLLTLWMIREAIQLGRVLGGNIFYINADDNSSGAADKARFFDELQIHSLIPGWNGFDAKQLIHLLMEMVRISKCRGVVIIVDTLKKVTDLMDKKGSAAFGDAVRQFVAKGGTFIGLAHTRKSLSPTGKLVHGGTTDLMEDADAACVLTPLEIRGAPGEKVVTFVGTKRRGNNLDEAYAYASGGTSSYDELLASVRKVDPDNVDRFVAEHEERSDQPVIDAIIASIAEGIVMKMLLADEASKRAKVSTRRAIQVIERYQGDDLKQHRWTYAVRERGAKVYRLLTD